MRCGGRLQALAPKSLAGDDTAIVTRLVGRDEFLQRCEEPQLSERGGTEIPNKFDVIVQHMKNQPCTTLRTGRHPLSLPFSEAVDLPVHYLSTWQDKLSGQQVAEPAGLEAIGQSS